MLQCISMARMTNTSSHVSTYSGRPLALVANIAASSAAVKQVITCRRRVARWRAGIERNTATSGLAKRSAAMERRRMCTRRA